MKRTKQSILSFSLLLITLLLVGCGQAVAEVDIGERIESQDTPVLTWGVKANTNLFGFYHIQSGKIDGILATMTITEEREKQVDFSDVYFNGGQSLLVPEDSEINGIEDLTADHTVLAIKGSSSTQNMRELAPQVEVLDLENYSEGFVALQSGQGHALTTDDAILLGMIDQNPNYRLAGQSFTEEPYGIAINKGQDALHHLLEDALDTIQGNCVYDAIYDKWFGEMLPADAPGSPSTSTTGAAEPASTESGDK